MALSTTRTAAQQAVKSIGVLLYPGFELLDVTGPLEMLGSRVLSEHLAKDDASLSFTYISSSSTAGPVASAQAGARLVADCQTTVHEKFHSNNVIQCKNKQNCLENLLPHWWLPHELMR